MEPDLLSSSSSDSPWRYHVFLSSRGEDTRRHFVSFLYAALGRKGLIVFRDEETLMRGDSIRAELYRAIEESLCTIVILSSNYASSTWCLDELVKALDCRKRLGRIVIPIFYGVQPSNVRNQEGSFGKAFHEHELRFRDNMERVHKWRMALAEVGSTKGWDVRNGHEAELIEKVVQFACENLLFKIKLPSNDNGLVAIDSRLEEIYPLLRMDSEDVQFIGLWGMGGIGKTTLLRIIYDRIQHQFDVSCYLANVREVCERSDGLIDLQRKILSHIVEKGTEIEDLYYGKKKLRNLLYGKKILLLLDDISATSQLENLAEEPEWFGPGSRVIVTTRDVNLLISQGGLFETYEVEILNPDDSLQLFCQNAFKRDQPEEGYLELSNKATEYAGGNPLALKVLGQFFFGRGVSEWEDALKEMEEEFVTFIRTELIKKSPLQPSGTTKLPEFRAKKKKDQSERSKKTGKREMKIEDLTTTGQLWDGIDESVKETEATLLSMNGEQKQIMIIDHEDEIVVSDDEIEESFQVEHCPKITVSKKEKNKLYEPWRHSLIVKLQGKTLEYDILLQNLKALWIKEGQLSVFELGNDYFAVKFTKEKDYWFALLFGPWLIDGHYLIVQRWRLGFDPFDDEVKCVPVWIRVSGLPLEYYNIRLLWRVGNCLGKTLGVDNNSFTVSRAQFARIYVEMDFSKRLISRIQLKKKKYSVEYEEGLPQICFKCGQYGHKKESCPSWALWWQKILHKIKKASDFLQFGLFWEKS